MSEKWRNWTARYENVDIAEVMRKLKAAAEKTYFCPPPRAWRDGTPPELAELGVRMFEPVYESDLDTELECFADTEMEDE